MEYSKNKPRCLLEEKRKVFDLMQVFPVLLDDPNLKDIASHGIAPSIYMKEMLLTTEERTAITVKRGRYNKKLIAGQPSGSFCATPSIVIFQQFSPGNTYRVTLSVTNITPSSQNLRMDHTRNPWFSIECKDVWGKRKLAPGMSMICDVKFTPEEGRDYEYEAVFAMGIETFTVSILAIGPRPLLDLPDSVEVPQTAIKIPSAKHFLVRNIGNMPAVFSLSTISPFTVSPQKGILAEGDSMQVAVTFLSEKTGCFKENLIATYETGEVISLNLSCYAGHGVVELERGSVTMEKTYLGLTRSKTFAIYNRSEYISKFRWGLYENGIEDKLERETYTRSLGIIKNIEAVRRVDLEHYGICGPLLHELTCQRVYADELSYLVERTFLFRHPNFRLVPLEGEIWPHSSVDVMLIFEPDEVGVVNSRAYLEVTGCEERILLNLHGTCVGPLIRLNITCADLGCIFLCSNHNYEVICGNKGDIPGTLIHQPRPADCGGKITVTPVQVKLQPGSYKSFNLSFSSNRTGDFTETVNFLVKEDLAVISLLIKGSVICPKLHFDKQNIDFGTTALGFTTKHDVCLYNSSLVPVTFRLAITQDGTQPALTYEDFARCTTKPSLVGDPKEFAPTPCEGVLAPRSSQRITISYTPNVVRSSQTALRADMWDSDSEPVTLPIKFSSKVASLVVRPSEILIRFCFINFPYMRSITVENKSDVEGYFYLPPQSAMMNSTVMYSLSLHQGHLKPNESKSISLKIITTALDRQKVQLSLLAFGSRRLALCCSLICNGQGPIVTVQPTHLNWGKVRLLKEVKSTISLFNDSPIPAQFVASLHKTPSWWAVSPSSGALESNKSLELEITVHLCDTGKYSDSVDIKIMNGRVVTCSLSAVGTGTSIHLVPPMIPVFDMGLLFRDQDISIPITMVNKGTRHHRLTWTTVAELRPPQPSGARERQQDKFTIAPNIVELSPGAEVIVHCKMRWGVNELLTEQWYLHGQIDGLGTRQVLGASLFTAMCTEPNIVFSKRRLTFRYDAGLSESNTQPTDTLFVTNRSRLDLRARATIDKPFEIITENKGVEFRKSIHVLLENEVKTGICVGFNTQAIDMSNLYSTTFRGVLTFEYETHVRRDKIKCVAEVNYPNISILPTKPVILSCEVGSCAYETLTLANTGHLPVNYSFEWLAVDMPYLQSKDSGSAISSDQDKKSEEVEEGEEGNEENEEGDKVEKIRDGDLFERKLPEISSITDLDRFTLSSPAALNANPGESGRQPSTPATTFSREAINQLSSVYAAAGSGVQDLIFPMVEQYFLEDAEIFALKDPRAPTADASQYYCGREFVTQILDVVPSKGTVMPYSSGYAYFALDAPQRMKIDAKVACRVESGPTEAMNVRAVADTIRYFIDKKHINFHRQLLGKTCRTTLTIVNRGVVGFTFETHPISEGMPDETPAPVRLRLEPSCGVVEPMSQTCLDVSCYLDMPGPFHERFDLEIVHRTPVSIHVVGHGSLPQVYLTVPRLEAFERLPIEVFYQALGTLTTRLLTEARSFAVYMDRIMPTIDDDTLGCRRIPKRERERLADTGWEVISCGQILPSVMDVEMAVERLLTTGHMRENQYILAKHHSGAIKWTGVSSLLVPEYVIDMGCVVIEQVGRYSATLINYGPTTIDIRVRRAKSKCSVPKKSGIDVQFHYRKGLPVGESIPLNVTFHPNRSTYTEKRTDVEHTIYLEVIGGATIPVSVRAVATYPFLTTNTAHLSFEDVAVGNCMLMPILLRNEGWVPCEWDASIRCDDSCRSTKEIGPFFLHNNTDTFLPGYEGVINIYFKPKEAKRWAGQLRITVHQSIFPVLVSMSGRGTEPDLQVFEESLRFETAIPYTQPQEKIFLVKNIGMHPVEVFWRNFDTSFAEEERVVRILMHYYGVDEILFPPRRPGDKLPPRVYDFYRTLSEEMMAVLAARKSGSERRADKVSDKVPFKTQDMKSREKNDKGIEEEEDADEDRDEMEEVEKIYNEIGTARHQPSEKKVVSLAKRLTINESVGRGVVHDPLSWDRTIEEFPVSPGEDPDQVEARLHRYIEELHDREDFPETMKDPMRGVFEDADIESLQVIDDASTVLRPCIIFHGAPFTEYQQAACHVAKIICVPVLNINNAVIEIIALGNSACSMELRKIVDKNYDELLSSSESYREKVDANRPRSNTREAHPIPGTLGEYSADHVHAANSGTPVVLVKQIPKNSDTRMARPLKLTTGPDVVEEFNKIPKSDELGELDTLDKYEYKIQSILLLQRMVRSATTAEGSNLRKLQRDATNDKASGIGGLGATNRSESDHSTFLGIGAELICEALRQRLSMQDFQAGCTVQTIDNIFVKNDRDILVMLLSIVGNVRYLLFVTFNNTLNLYLSRNEKLAAAEETKETEELQNKLTKIEQMTRTDYDQISENEKIMYASKTLAAKRKDSLRRQLVYNHRFAEAVLNRKTPPLSKRASVAAALTDKIRSSNGETNRSETIESRGVSSIGRESTLPTNSRSNNGGIGRGDTTKTEKYRLPGDLNEISRLMDAYRTSLNTLQPVLANWDPREATYTETAESRGIDVWYVAPNDPWDSRIYDAVVSHLKKHHDMSGGTAERKTYLPRVMCHRCEKSLLHDVYTLTSVVQVPAAERFTSHMIPLQTQAADGDIPRNTRPEEFNFIDEPLMPRWIMMPDEVRKLRVHFAPTSIGIHKQEYNLSVVGSEVTRLVEISGSADIPRLNMAPEVIFDKVEGSKLNNLNKPAYFFDTKTYDFGSIPLMNIDERRAPHTRDAKFVFSNTSTTSAAVSFFLMNNAEDYGISPLLLNIAPGESNILNVGAGVSKAGPNSERLLLCIRNNPQVEVIQLQSCGSKVEVELEGKLVSFDKVLLWRKAKRTILVKNKSSIPLYWRLNCATGTLDPQVTMHPERGLVEPFTTVHTECSYSAKLVGIVERKIIAFHVYLDESDTEPSITDFITVTGETYDVQVALTDVNPIDLKRVMVGTLATESFKIENCGPVQPDMSLSLGQLKSNYLPTLNEDLQVEPAKGSLAPGESMVVTVNFLPRDALTVSEAPLLKCILIDALSKSPTVVAELPLSLSLSAQYAKVKIEPSRVLEFGALSIFDEKTMQLDIENDGYFSFHYKINGRSISELPSNAFSTHDKRDKRSRTENAHTTDDKAPRTAKVLKSSRGDPKTPSLRVGPFSLSPDEGEVRAGEIATITVRCCPDSVAIFEEEVQVFVPNTGRNMRDLPKVKLSVNACIPTIDFHDLGSIFQKNIVVDKVTDFACPRELGSHSIYGRQENCLYFRRTGLSSTHSVQFRLHNPGILFSDVAVTFSRETNDSLNNNEGGTAAFAVEPQGARIFPMSSKVFTVSFAPKLSGSYTAELCILLELPPPLRSPQAVMKVCGEGDMPKLLLLEPTTPPHMNDEILMNFGRVLVGETDCRLLNFKNVGTIEAHVIAEISEDARGFYGLAIHDRNVSGLHDTARQRHRDADRRRIVRCLMPEEIASVIVEFASDKVGKHNGRIDIFAINNRHERIAVVISGESYVEDLVLEGLTLMENVDAMSLIGKRSSRSRRASRDSQAKSPTAASAEFTTPIVTYKLDFGSCPLNQFKRLCFKITSRSGKHLFRFEWGSHPHVVFSPAVGHLDEHGSKDIIATFFAAVSTVHAETLLECTINQITRLPGEMYETCWDDRQIKLRWDNGGSGDFPEPGEGISSREEIFAKVAEPMPEPGVVRYVIPGSRRTVRVVVCATADYARYGCSVGEVNFNDVAMFKRCEFTFVLSNSGIVDMSYRWNLLMDTEDNPLRLSDSALKDVLRSLDDPHMSQLGSKSRMSSVTLYPKNRNCLQSSMLVSPPTAGDGNNKTVKVRQVAGAANILDVSSSTTVSKWSSADSRTVEDYLPFKITPEAGVLLPGKSAEFTLVFAPLDVFDYGQAYLKCSIENLNPELPPLNIVITARSPLPSCDVNVPIGDCQSDGKRYTDSPGQLGTGMN